MPETTDRLVLSHLVVQAGTRVVVDDVGFELQAGQILALVGASGSGKTLTARACMGLVTARPGVVSGQVSVHHGAEEHQLYDPKTGRARPEALARTRGRLVGYLPQDARASLDPLWTIGKQVAEVVRLAGGTGAPGEAVDHWLLQAGFARPDRIRGLYPHELSGGMAQRASIALGLARGARFLLADEPTTGLDPTVQQGIIAQVRGLVERGIGVLFITHDLRIVPRLADQVAVMHEGKIVDLLPARALRSARSPAALRLLEATARVAGGTL